MHTLIFVALSALVLVSEAKSKPYSCYRGTKRNSGSCTVVAGGCCYKTINNTNKSIISSFLIKYIYLF